jgi:hypothetical protein
VKRLEFGHLRRVYKALLIVSYRQFLTVLIKTFARFVVGQKLKIFSDNQNVVRILSVESNVPALQHIAVRFFQFSLSHNTSFQVQWIPRSANAKADYLSRLIDPDDWYFIPRLFTLLTQCWGPFDVDRMSDHNNAQLRRFNSRFWCPGTEAVDCFTQNWSNCNNWVCPPPTLILAVLKHMEICNAKGVVIVPEWQSAPFWPKICPYPLQFVSFVTGVYYLPQIPDTFIPGPGTLRMYQEKQSVFQGSPKFKVIALRVNFQG